MTDATKEDLLDILNEKQEEIDWLKAELDEANHSRELSDAECVTLRKERDEARRELCAARRELCRNEAIIRLQRHRVHRDSEDVVGLAKEIAVERGWDCFKENSNV